jgi:putative oxidoreductase
MKTLEWILRLAVAGILLQTLYFKFSGAEESRYIFQTLGAEPWGRIGSGVAELIAAVLILNPGTVGLGAALALGIISGALLSHLTILGIDIMGDGGLLFYLALAVFVGSAILCWNYRHTLPIVGHWFSKG